MATPGGRPISLGKELPVDIRQRRDRVQLKYQDFTKTVTARRLKLEQAKQLHQFYSDADNLDSWINDKIQIASDEAYKERRNLQVFFNHE